jgi:hypothetical protein
MTSFATGRKSWAISDRSGQRFPYVEMVTEWNGSFVHISEYEPKQPQLEPKIPGNDPQGLLNARPDRTEPAVIVALPYNPLYATAGSSTIVINDPGHGNKIGNSIIILNPTAGNGFSIATLTTTLGYTLTSVSSDTYSVNLPTVATGTGFFGGGNVSIGPSAVELGEFPFLVTVNSSTIIVSDANHGRVTGNTVVFSNVNALNNFNSSSGFDTSVLATSTGYSITVLNLNTYSFNAYSGIGLGNMTIGGGYVTAQTIS